MIYLLRFTEPLGNPKTHQAAHYVGYCEYDIEKRLAHHRAGYGARITRAAAQRCTGTEPFELIWCIEGDRRDERRIKNYKHHARFAAMTGEQVRAWLEVHP